MKSDRHREVTMQAVWLRIAVRKLKFLVSGCELQKNACLLIFCLFLVSSTATVSAESQIINIDAKYNPYSNPQYLYLSEGDYALEYIGPAQGGRHTARNAWRGISVWCIYQSNLCELGWTMGTLIGGDKLLYAPKYLHQRLNEQLFYCQPQSLLTMTPPNLRRPVFSSAEAALNAMRTAQDRDGFCPFEMTAPGFIKVFDGDRKNLDNHGGISVQIRTTSPSLDFVVDILPGSHANVIEVSDAGTVEVAILGDVQRDVGTIRPETLSLLPDASPLKVLPAPTCRQGEVNSDEYPDLVCHFIREPSEIGPGATRVHLAGLTTDGKLIKGWDVATLRIVNKPQVVRKRSENAGSY
jgi:hypothetical protein